jgi:replicative DNA helicase
VPPLRDRQAVLQEAQRLLGRAPKLAVMPDTVPVLDVVAEQFDTARRELHESPAVVVRFPYASVHAMAGRLTAGKLVFVMANTGQGKTTFFLDVLDHWAEAGVGIDYLGTEQQPDELITKWACRRADVPAGVAIGKEWDEYAQGETWRARVAAELDVIESTFGAQVLFSPDKFITLPKIEAAAQSAHRRGAHVLMVDHVDRIDVGDRETEYVALKRLIRRLKELARDCKLVLVVASQMNREARKSDRLGAYRPPQLHQMQGGGTKEQEADVVLGLWRPLRQQREDETAAQFKAVMASAKAGHVPTSDVTEPNTMAVVLLKHRTHGERDGNRCKLSVHHGRIADIPERDRFSTSYDGQKRI